MPGRVDMMKEIETMAAIPMRGQPPWPSTSNQAATPFHTRPTTCTIISERVRSVAVNNPEIALISNPGNAPQQAI